MADLLFKLEGQLLSRQNDVVISSGNANTDICIYDFDVNWNGFIKTAVPCSMRVNYASEYLA